MQVGKCHPLGSFEQMEAIHIARFVWNFKHGQPDEVPRFSSTPAELYSAVLVDTPLAPFFESCINEQVGNKIKTLFQPFLSQDLDEMNIEIIRNTLYKVQFSIQFWHFSFSKHGAIMNCPFAVLP